MLVLRCEINEVRLANKDKSVPSSKALLTSDSLGGLDLLLIFFHAVGQLDCERALYSLIRAKEKLLYLWCGFNIHIQLLFMYDSCS